MRIYLDTEFNGHGGPLLSMALVPEDPIIPPWYEVAPFSGFYHPWVAENVAPKFGKEAIPRFKESFQEYILQFSDPEVICDWNADAVHFCRLLEGPTYDSSLDFGCTIRILRTPPGAVVPEDPHNALSDALALRKWHTGK